MQYEDPTDDLQMLRTKVELQRAVKLQWLQDLAANAAKALSAAQGASGDSSTAANVGLITSFSFSEGVMKCLKQQLHPASIVKVVHVCCIAVLFC